jgi:hypothetical protein
MTRYTIAAAAAALAAGLFLQTHAFVGPNSVSTSTVTPPSNLNLGDPTAGAPDQARADANAALAAGANLPPVGGGTEVVAFGYGDLTDMSGNVIASGADLTAAQGRATDASLPSLLAVRSVPVSELN